MPWQKQVAAVALEVDPDTQLPAYRTVVLTVPRQSGKSTLILSLFLQRCMSEFWKASGRPDGPAPGRQRCIYAAQTQKDARQKWESDYVADMEASPKLAGKFDVYRGSGRESIRFPNRSSIGITANTEKAAHGQVLDMPVVDEAFSLVDDRLDQAFVPAMSTRRQGQLWIVSTAGTPDSLYLKAKVDKGRELVEAGTTSGLAYFEWSAPEDADPDDEEAWARCMPALGHTIDLSVVRAARQTLSTGEFQRAYLNQWIDRDAGERVISAEHWNRSFDPDSEVDGRVVLSLDVSRDRDWSCIGMAGHRDNRERVHVQTVAHGPGTDWVVRELGHLREQVGPRVLVLDAAGPAGSMLPELVADGWELGETLIVTGAREMAQACGAFYDDVVNDRVRHVRQPELEAAVIAGRKRELLDTWAWGRKASSSDITPLVGVTLAHWALSVKPDKSYDPLKSFY
jgi:phage terminase large subunit-like protein